MRVFGVGEVQTKTTGQMVRSGCQGHSEAVHQSLPELTVHDTEPQINANKPHLVDEKLHDAKNRHRFLACVECRRGVSKITTQNLKSATIREFVFVCLMAGTDGLSILLA